MLVALLAAIAALGGVFAISGGGSSGGGGSTAVPSTTDDDPDPVGDDDTIGDDPTDEPADEPIAEPEPDAPAPGPDPSIPDSAYTLDWGGINAEEQMIVELINRARLDPDGEVARQGVGFASGVGSTPKEALAVTEGLSEASRDHSEDMDNRDFFAHTNPDNESPSDRAIEADHGSRYVGENIGWVGSSRTGFDAQGRAEAHHDNLWASPGHQQNLMREGWSEIGVGYDYGSYRGLEGSTFVTEMFGDRSDTYLTGVVIDDEDGDAFYDIGEGQGDVRITAYKDDEAFTTATWDAGGYSLKLDPGTYRVVFEGGDLEAVHEETVTIGSENVKLDIIEETVGGAGAAMAANSEPDIEASQTLSEMPLVDEGEVLLSDLLPDTGEPGWEDEVYVEDEPDDEEGIALF